MGTHDGHRGRLKTEFLARPDSFPDHKVLELLLFYANPRGDTNPIAHALTERFGSLAGVLDAPVEELVKVPGIGDHAAVLIKAVKDLSRRYLTARTDMAEIIRRPSDCYHLLRPYFVGATAELVYLLCMDGKQKVLGIRKVSEGDVNSASITPRRLAEAALSLNASRVVLAHNHVSGLAMPSGADRTTTLHLREVLQHLGVVLTDHVIFADDDMVSMAASGFLPPEGGDGYSAAVD